MTATPLTLYDPTAVYNCPEMLPKATTWQFEADSDNASVYGGDVKMNYELTAKGLWVGAAQPVFRFFAPGIYTVVGGDEWGAVAVLHFVVLSNAAGQPIEVVSLSDTYEAGHTINPAGPEIEMTLKNVSTEPIVSLSVILEEPRPGPTQFTFDFPVSSSSPLKPGKSTSARIILIGGGWGGGIPYSLTISGTLQSGATFTFTRAATSP